MQIKDNVPINLTQKNRIVPVEATLVNLSKSNLRLKTEKFFSGSIDQISIKLPDGKEIKATTEARYRKKENGYWVYNVLLKEINMKELISLKNFIKNRIKAINFFTKELEIYLNFLHNFQQRNICKKTDRKILQKEFNKACDRIIEIGEALEKEIYFPSIKKEIRNEFRKSVGKWVYQSQIMKRSFEKPRGYAGDYKTIEMFYNHISISNGVGYYFDEYVVSNTLATADIYRKNKMKELLKNFIENQNSDELEILNLGCGSCREIKELFFNYSPSKNIRFVCVDQDLEAIEFSKRLTDKLPPNVTIEFLQKNIIDLIKEYKDETNIKKPLGEKQLVYSIGLVDYFADNVLRLFVRFCLKNLAPGGRLIFAHKNRNRNKSFQAPNWFCDWEFYKRDKREVLKIINDEIIGYNLNLVWEKTKHMFFLIITKNSINPK